MRNFGLLIRQSLGAPTVCTEITQSDPVSSMPLISPLRSP